MDERLRKLEREAAAGDPESAARLEAAQRRTKILPRWNPLTRVRCELSFACPQSWEQMPVTEQQGVRHCGSCDKDVHEAQTAEEFREHANAGHCVSVPRWATYDVVVEGETIRPRDLPIHRPTMGRPLTGVPVRPKFALFRFLLFLGALGAAGYGLAYWLGYAPWLF